MYQQLTIVGNLGRDPEMRYTPAGVAVANLTLATSESWKDKQSGENVERTEWHRIVIFQRLAEIAGEYLRKGSKVFIEGRLQTRKWQDKNTNQDRYTTEVIADSLQMLDSKGGANNTGGMEAPASDKSAMEPQSAPAESFDDDIPF